MCFYLTRNWSVWDIHFEGGQRFCTDVWCLGQFKATAAANPTLGTKGVLETVEEDRVEVLISDKCDVGEAIEELKKVGLRACTWLLP